MKLKKFSYNFEIPNPNDEHSKLGQLPRTFLIDGIPYVMKDHSQLHTKLLIEKANTMEEFLENLKDNP